MVTSECHLMNIGVLSIELVSFSGGGGGGGTCSRWR